MEEIVGQKISYYWTLWQSELAKDYIFKDSATVNALMDDFQLYALVTGNGERILKYFGSPVRPNGQPHPRSNVGYAHNPIKIKPIEKAKRTP